MNRSTEPPTSKRLPLLGAAAAFFFLVFAGLAGMKSLRDLDSAREREKTLSRRVDETRERIDYLETRLERLRSDPSLLEKLAREELGMALPGDVIVELPRGTQDTAKSSPPSATTAPPETPPTTPPTPPAAPPR